MRLMATFLVTCQIVIGAYNFTRANHVKIKTSWKELADTATIKLPLLKGKLNAERRFESLADKIKQGDKVNIKLGWIGLNKNYEFDEFHGYVKRVSPNLPLEIECEDAVWLLRQVNLEKSWRNTSLKDVVKYIVDEANKVNADKIRLSAKIPDVKFDKFTLDNVNGAEALQQIKEAYGLVAYFRGLELFAGLAFTELVGRVKYSMDWNVPQSKLTYRRAEDTRIRLKATSILRDNKKIEVEVGPKSGELVSRFYYNISDEATLKRIAEKDIDKMRFEGYEGSITTCLVPFVTHSMTAELRDPEFENHNGNYIVDEVVTEGFSNGIKRTVKIGKRV